MRERHERLEKCGTQGERGEREHARECERVDGDRREGRGARPRLQGRWRGAARGRVSLRGAHGRAR